MKIHNIFKTAAALAVSTSLLTACAGNNGSQTASDGTELRTIRVANMTGEPDQYAGYHWYPAGHFRKVWHNASDNRVRCWHKHR